MLRVIDLAGCVPLVRVSTNDPTLIKRVMDAGAHGVIVPMVNTAQEARAAVSAVRYPPTGTRGVGLWRAQGYGMSFAEYQEWLERESVVVVQIEHIRAVENIEETRRALRGTAREHGTASDGDAGHEHGCRGGPREDRG